MAAGIQSLWQLLLHNPFPLIVHVRLSQPQGREKYLKTLGKCHCTLATSSGTGAIPGIALNSLSRTDAITDADSPLNICKIGAKWTQQIKDGTNNAFILLCLVPILFLYTNAIQFIEKVLLLSTGLERTLKKLMLLWNPKKLPWKIKEQLYYWCGGISFLFFFSFFWDLSFVNQFPLLGLS